MYRLKRYLVLKLWDVANVHVEEILSAESLGCSQCTGLTDN